MPGHLPALKTPGHCAWASCSVYTHVWNTCVGQRTHYKLVLSSTIYVKKLSMGVGEVGQWLKALAFLPEYPGLAPNIHMEANNYL